jgi:hypothetical protein
MGYARIQGGVTASMAQPQNRRRRQQRTGPAGPPASIPIELASGREGDEVDLTTSPRDRLAGVIEGEIVPRLLLSLSASSRAALPRNSEGGLDLSSDQDDVTELVRLLLAHDLVVACAFVDLVRSRGKRPECICVDLLAPAAHRLAEVWERDGCNFSELIAGLSRLKSLVREVSAAASRQP